MESSTSTGLLSLPQELVNVILIEIGDSYKTFRALARVCRKLNALSNPFVYNSVIIRQPSTGEKFAWTMTHAPRFNPMVHGLQIHFHGTGDDEPFNIPEDFETVLAKLVNLELLVIKSDYFDNEQDTNLFCQPGILPALRSCKPIPLTILPSGIFIIFVYDEQCSIVGCGLTSLPGHLGFDYDNTDESTWILHPYEAVFFHPGLRSLTITGACVQTVWSRLKGAPSHRSTQLEELRLLNCDLAPHQLSEMLSYPRALKHFTFKGQSPDPIVTGPVREANRSAYIDALRIHASSLESLDLDLYYHWTEPINLTEFKALKKLRLSPRMLTGDGRVYQSPIKNLPSTFSLEDLILRHDDEPETVIMPESESCPCSCWSYRHRLNDTYP